MVDRVWKDSVVSIEEQDDENGEGCRSDELDDGAKLEGKEC